MVNTETALLCKSATHNTSETVTLASTDLYGNIQSRNVERLKHNFCSILAVLGCVQRWFCEEKIVVLWLCPQILEDALLPESLH